MNPCDIRKLLRRQRAKSEVKKLQVKVARVISKNIKLAVRVEKVAQDMAYWDLNEHLKMEEENHERLQQNKVKVKKQHEATSSKYCEELRLRQETLNMLASTRENCNALNEQTEDLQGWLRSAQADRNELEAELRAARIANESRIAERAAAAEEEARNLRTTLNDLCVQNATKYELAHRNLQVQEKERAAAELRYEIPCLRMRRCADAATQLQNEAERRAVEEKSSGEALAATESRSDVLEAEVEKLRHETAAGEAALAELQREVECRRQLLQAKEESLRTAELRVETLRNCADTEARVNTDRGTPTQVLRETEAARENVLIQLEEARLRAESIAAEKEATVASLKEHTARLAAREEAARKAASADIELAARAATIAQLKCALAHMAEERASVETELAATRADLDASRRGSCSQQPHIDPRIFTILSDSDGPDDPIE